MSQKPLLRIAFTFFVGIALFPVHSQAPSAGLEDTVRVIQNLGPRMENTKGEQDLLSFIVSEAKRRSLQVSSIPISEYSGEHSFSQIIEVVIPGTGEGTLAFVLPVSSGLSWGDSAYGIATVLDLWDLLADSPLEISTRFAFLGADEELLGSRAYASYLADEPFLAVLRTEIGCSEKKSVELLFGGNGELSPYWFLKKGIGIIKGSGFQDVVRANRSILYRIGLTDSQTALDPWFQKGIPALTLRVSSKGGSSETSSDKTAAGAYADLLAAFARSFAGGVPDQWDRQYVLFEILGYRIAIRETQYIAIVLIIFSVLGLVFALDSMRRRDILLEDLRRFPRGSAALIAVFAALFLCVLTSRIVLSALLALIEAPDYWRLYPVRFSGMRIAQLFTLFLGTASLLARAGIIPRRAEFFRGSAIVILGADVLLFSALRVALSLLFLWAFIIAIAGRRAGRKLKKAWPSALALPLSLIPLGFVASELIRSPEYVAFKGLLLPDALGMAYLCFMALPFLLIIVAFGESIFGPEFYRARTAAFGAAAFLAVSLGGMIFAYADARAFDGETDVVVREYADEALGELRIEVSSLRPLPRTKLARGGESVELDGRASRQETRYPRSDILLSLSVKEDSFLDRTQIILAIDSSSDPYRIRVEIPRISSGSIYDCSYPFSATADGRGIVIFVGARPLNPLTVSLTVSKDFESQAYVIAQFGIAPDPFSTEGRIRVKEHSAEYRSAILLRSKKSLNL